MIEHWWTAAERRDALEAVAGLDVAAWMEAAGEGARLSSDRQSAAVRLDGDPPLLVKWRRPLPGRRGRTFLRASREQREAWAMRRARAIGIPCPEPWAVGERRRWGVLLGSVYVRAFDADAVTGAQALAEDAGALAPLTEALRGWHDLGFRHGDGYPKNVLVRGGEAQPRPIGCPSARFVHAGPRLDRTRLKDLAQWAAARTEYGGAAFDFLATYAAAPRLPPAAALEARVRPFYDRVMARKAERLATRPQREPDGPPLPVPLPAGERTPRVVMRDIAALV